MTARRYGAELMSSVKIYVNSTSGSDERPRYRNMNNIIHLTATLVILSFYDIVYTPVNNTSFECVGGLDRGKK